MEDRTPSTETLRRRAKRLKRENGGTLAAALDAVAKQHGFGNWSQLAKAAKRPRPGPDAHFAVAEFVRRLGGRLDPGRLTPEQRRELRRLCGGRPLAEVYDYASDATAALLGRGAKRAASATEAMLFADRPAYRAYCDFVAANWHRMGADDGTEPSAMSAAEEEQWTEICRAAEAEEAVWAGIERGELGAFVAAVLDWRPRPVLSVGPVVLRGARASVQVVFGDGPGERRDARAIAADGSGKTTSVFRRRGPVAVDVPTAPVIAMLEAAFASPSAKRRWKKRGSKGCAVPLPTGSEWSTGTLSVQWDEDGRIGLTAGYAMMDPPEVRGAGER